MDILDNIAIILSHTSHPGNIGATARAMKNMGLKNLILISPLDFPSEVATSRAGNAVDILENAKVFPDIESALSDFHIIYGISGKHTSLEWPKLSIKEAAPEVIKAAKASQKVGLLFGKEQCGLLMTELERCQKRIFIPANPLYDSLNLAQAVQVITYEIYSAVETKGEITGDFSTNEEREGFFAHLKETLKNLEFLNEKQPKKLLSRLRRLYNRINLDKSEIKILRGILTAVNSKIKV